MSATCWSQRRSCPRSTVSCSSSNSGCLAGSNRSLAPEHGKILHRYATWHTLRRLRAAAATGPIGHYRDQIARRNLRVTAKFLEHLTDRGTALAECRQRDLDGWFAHASDSDKTARVRSCGGRSRAAACLAWTCRRSSSPRRRPSGSSSGSS
jgi:hypothetical protein